MTFLPVGAIVAAQSGHYLERLPTLTLLAEGRVIESAPVSLVVESRDASIDGTQVVDVERISFDLDEAEGYVYFVQEELELSLREGLQRLRPGAWLEVAPMPGRVFSKWRVAGSHDSTARAQPGRIDPLLQSRPEIQHFAVSGWLYIWVLSVEDLP